MWSSLENTDLMEAVGDTAKAPLAGRPSSSAGGRNRDSSSESDSEVASEASRSEEEPDCFRDSGPSNCFAGEEARGGGGGVFFFSERVVLSGETE